MRLLRVAHRGGRWASAAGDFDQFMNCLLLLRNPRSALDEVELRCFHYAGLGGDAHYGVWIRHALLCHARVLTVDLVADDEPLRLGGAPLLAPHLRRLELASVDLDGNFLDFASCPVLEDLKLALCKVRVGKISSQSVKFLSIERCEFDLNVQTRMSVPSLIVLKLDYVSGKHPLVETMPSLEIAFVRSACLREFCVDGYFGESCGSCIRCYAKDDYDGRCLLLGGLSSATNLELIARPGVFPDPIFKRDLRWCPTFSRLKTLMLNEWGLTVDLHALICLLKHAPILEKLTLQISKTPHCKVESRGNYSPVKQLLTISEHLHTIEIKCGVVDWRVTKVLTLLSRFATQINIITGRKWSHLFSFEKR